jgi:hypothetical protein
MGCDIHLFSEKKKTVNGIEKWVNADYWKINPYFGDDDYEPELELVSIYRNRNYALFNILAEVRGNGPSISQPRGLPDDVSDIVKKESDRWDSDGHSHSYFTLAELKKYYGDNSHTSHNGFLSKRAIKELDEDSKTPYNWVEWSGPDLEYREWKEESPLKPLVDNVDKRMRDEFWIGEDEEDTSKFDEKFRIVFWFDN